MQRADNSKDTSYSAAKNAYAVTPHDTNEIGTYEPKAIYVGTGGTIVMKLVGDTASTTWTNVPDGALLPVRPSVILATGTTASDIIAIY